MKKQLFSLMLAFALVVGLSVSTWAQQGWYPNATYEIAIGSSATFTVPVQGTNTYEWDVFELASTHVVGAPDAATVVGTKVTLSAATANSTIATFYAMPESGNLFVVQVTETEPAGSGSCSTVRRFYVSLFNFDIQVIALAANTGVPATPLGAAFSGSFPELAECNSWSNTVIKNEIDSLMLTSMRADSVNNPTDGDLKYTDSYFAVRLYVEGGASLANYRSRFQWSMDSTSASTSIYQIEVVDGPARFAAEGGVALWASTGPTAAITTPTAYAGGTFDGNQTFYIGNVSATEAISVIRVRTHNLAGVADMEFNMKIDRVQLERDATGGTYNNGDKYNVNTNAVATDVARLDNNKDISFPIVIRQSPATPVIDVLD